MQSRNDSTHTHTHTRFGWARRLIVALVASAIGVGATLVATALPASAWACPDGYSSGIWWDGICLYEDDDWRTDHSTAGAANGYSIADTGHTIGRWEETTVALKYKGTSTSANNNATSIRNTTVKTVYYYDSTYCPADGSIGTAYVTLGSGYGDKDLNDGTGYKYDNRISSFARSNYRSTCQSYKP